MRATARNRSTIGFALALLAGCSAAPQSTTVAGVATLVGLSAFEGISDGVYSVLFKNGAYAETIPNVLALGSGRGFIVDQTLYPLVPIEVPRARRLASSSTLLLSGLTPDAAQALYQTDHTDSGANLWLAPVGGDAPFEMGTNGDISGTKFSSDSKWVAFTSDYQPNQGGTLNVLSLIDHTRLILGTEVYDFSFAPDGSAIVFASGYAAGGTGTIRYSTLPDAATMLVPEGREQYGFSSDSKHLLVATDVA